MTQLKILSKILYKEFFKKTDIKKDKKQIFLYFVVVLYFLLVSINLTPTKELDYNTLNDTIVLGFLQIFIIAIMSYIFSYVSIEFSYNLNMFFKINFLNNIYLGSLKKILMFIGVGVFSLLILLIQAGIPLIQALKFKLFIKFIILTFLGVNLSFVVIDFFVNFLEKNYFYMDISLPKIKVIILTTLSVLYFALYYTSLKVWFNNLKHYDFYNTFISLNFICVIILFLISCIFALIYCIFFNRKILISAKNYKYYAIFKENKFVKYTKYLKLLTRNTKLIFVSLLIFFIQLLNFFTVCELSIANIFSMLNVVIGINFYSYLTEEAIFLKLNYNKDEYKILFSLILVYIFLNFPYIVIAKSQVNYILESIIIYLFSIFLGIIFPREDNTLNKFMSNFLLFMVISIFTLVVMALPSDTFKLAIYIIIIVSISIMILRIIRRLYETKNL